MLVENFSLYMWELSEGVESEAIVKPGIVVHDRDEVELLWEKVSRGEALTEAEINRL